MVFGDTRETIKVEIYGTMSEQVRSFHLGMAMIVYAVSYTHLDVYKRQIMRF